MIVMKVALVQFAPEFGMVEENLEILEQLCADLRCDLLVLPELCTTGYQFRDRQEASAFAEDKDGPSIKRLAGIAERCGGALVAGIAEASGDQIFNSAALINSDGVLGWYRKVHLFGTEKDCFDPGDLGFPVFDLGEVKLGMMICFDWLFPESARSLALAGAHIIAHPANLVLPYCQNAMITRALENRVFTITCNRIGQEERLPDQRLSFTGRSRMVGPDGTVLTEGPPDKAALITWFINTDRAGDKQITASNNIFADRRPDQYRFEK